nr:cupredoxin family copper-binding protein [Achromobacter veterisilvae]
MPVTRPALSAAWRRAGAAAAALCAGLALAGASARPADDTPDAKAAEHIVAIEGMRFVPATLTARRGDRVTWINRDLVPHTATALSRTFDSGAIAAGASWTYTVGEAGSIAYTCLFHPAMQGTLVAQ